MFGSYEHHAEESEPPVRYTFGACPVCWMPFVVEQTDYGQGFDDDESLRVYPQEDGVLKFDVPPVVRTSYDEAIGCQRAQRWVAAASMAGRTLEAVCRHELASPRIMIGAGLEQLRNQGKISEELLQWSEQLQFLRNDAAHASMEHITREDADDAIDLHQALLETLYHLRPKFEAMKARRARK
jgi:hypothetical protein